MAKLLFDVNRQLDMPTLILEAKSEKRYGSLNGVTGFSYKNVFANPNEISFNVQKYIDEKVNHLWDDISDLKTIYIPEYEEKFEIKVSYTDDELEEKSITGLDLCASELGQITIHELEINTDAYFELNDTQDEIQLIKFYNSENKEISLLDKIVSTYCPLYTIRHVDETLCDLTFEYSVDEVSVYDFFMGDVAEKMQCLFLFDSMTRSIDVYDLCSTCNECFNEVINKPSSEWEKYRDDFHDVCPKCGKSNIFKKGYGKDTTVLIDKENVATSIVKNTDADSIKNCFYVSGGDEEIDIAFKLSNPNGTQYLITLTNEMMNEMPSEFKTAWNNYQKLYNSYNTETEFNINSSLKKSYNSIIEIISNLDKNNEPYSNYKNHYAPLSFIGMKSLTTALYNAMDVNSFINVSMQPTYQVIEYDKYETLALLNSTNIGMVAVIGLNSETEKTYIERSILMVAKTLVNTGMYDIGIESSNYSNGVCDVVFSVKDRQNDDNETNTVTNLNYEEIANKEGRQEIPAISNSIRISVTDDVKTYCENDIKKKITSSDLPSSYEFYDLPSGNVEKDKELEQKLEKMIPLYSATCLDYIKQTLLSCREVLEERILDPKIDDTIKKKLEDYQSVYDARMGKIANEIDIKNGYLNTISSYIDVIQTEIKKVHDELNVENYLKKYSTADVDLWKIFVSYRREDTYKNENIISDGLDSNASIMQQADTLFKLAEKELIKASTPQITISGDLHNLLMFPEFEPLLDSFEVGNWIRVRTNINEENDEDEIYKLRLLSYEIHFEDIQKIDVEFSTVTRTWSGLRDVDDVIKTTQTMATNFNSTKKDVEKSVGTTQIVNGWVKDGLSLTNQKIVSNAIDQSIVIDEHGILARKYDDVSETYDDCQLKIFNNGLYTTRDNWKTISAGVGKFFYNDPRKNFEKTEGYGVIADTVVGSLILGNNLGIYNINGSMSFTEDGFIVEGENNSIRINPNDKEKHIFKIFNSSEPVMYTDENGNMHLKGIITAEAGGKIGGYTITDDSLYSGRESLNSANKGIYIGKSAISVSNGTNTVNINPNGNAFEILKGSEKQLYIDTNGNINLKGAVYATSGEFTGSIKSGSTITGTTISGGNINIGNGNFVVDTNGNLTTKGTMSLSDGKLTYDGTTLSVTGTINATKGAIANWTITGNRIECDKTSEGGYRSGMQSLGSNGSAAFYAGTTTKSGGEINSQDVSAFFVTQDGRLYSNKAIIKGTVTAETLKVKNKIYLYNDNESKYIQFVKYDVSNMITFGTSSQDNMYFEPGVQFNQGFYSHDYSEFSSKVGFCESIYLSANENIPTGESPIEQHINSFWKDEKAHAVLTVDNDLLTSAVGWAGSSDYKTVLKLRSQVVEAPYVSGITFSSDERLKNSLTKLDEFDDVYMDLKPVSFKYNNGSSGRKHFGFGASQVRDAFLNHGFTTKDFGGFVQMTAKENNEEYSGITDPMGLIYTEFPAWNTHMIQKTIKELNETKKELTNLQEKYNKLAEFVGLSE